MTSTSIAGSDTVANEGCDWCNLLPRKSFACQKVHMSNSRLAQK